MADEQSKNNRVQSDEIDLGQLFRLIGKGFQNIFHCFLRVFLYIKRRIIILGILAVLGGIAGYVLNKIVTKKQKIEVIVKPNWESKNYLYDVIDEIDANLKARNDDFFRKLGVEIDDFTGYEVTIETAGSKIEEQKGTMEYLELLQKFENTGIISDVLRAEILDKSSLSHRITFLFKDRVKGPILANKVMEYINSNAFFRQLTKINMENSEAKIEENHGLIQQIDKIIANYSEKIAQSKGLSEEGRIVLNTEEQLNVTELLDLKNNLIRDTESKRLQLLEQNEAIRIINIGKPQEVLKPFFGKNIILIPTLLIALFFFVDIIRYLNRKALEIQKS